MNERTLGEVVDAWSDLGPTQRSPSTGRLSKPSARVLEIASKLGMRFPATSGTDREAHAARVTLLAEDCSDINPDWLFMAAREWSQRNKFFPRACELRELALAIGRISDPRRMLTARRPEIPRPYAPPLTDEEIARMPEAIIALGISSGDIDPERAARLRKR